MSDKREEILNHEYLEFVKEKGVTSIYPKEFPVAYKDAAINAMDEYMKECCLDLLSYMAKNNITLSIHSTPNAAVFKHKGALLTKEQLFENFL